VVHLPQLVEHGAPHALSRVPHEGLAPFGAVVVSVPTEPQGSLCHGNQAGLDEVGLLDVARQPAHQCAGLLSHPGLVARHQR